MSKKAFNIFTALLAGLSLFAKTYAVCPVCTVAVVGGVLLAEKYGIDNTITGIWIGALTISLILWTFNWLSKKKIKFILMDTIVPIVYFLLVPVPLFLKDYIGNPHKTIWGVDKLIVGMILGALTMYASANAYEYVKKMNGNKPHFPFERVVMPIVALLFLSGIFYLITKG